MRTALALVGVVALAGLGPERARAQRYGAEPQVRSLQIEGNRAFSDGELKAAIATEATSCRTIVLRPFCLLTDWGFAHDRAFLDQDQLQADILRLRLYYWRRGYRGARVDSAVTRTDGDVRLSFRIEEGEPVRVDTLAVSVEREGVDRSRLRRFVPLRPGDRLDLTVLEEAENRVVDYLRNRGYAQADVLREYFIPSGTNRAEVILRAETGPLVHFGSVEITGNEKLGDGVIRELLTLREGGVYRYDRILDSQRNLYGLEVLRYANLDTRYREGTDSILDVTVNVTEADLHRVRTGVGVTTTDCVQTEASFTHRNFFGGARRLELSASLANLAAEKLGGEFPCTDVGPSGIFRDLNFQLAADFQQPNLLSSRNRLRSSVFFGRETVPNVFVRTSRGGEVGITRRLGSRMPLTFAYRPELTSFNERSADIFFCVNFGFCTPSDISTVTEARWLAPFALSWGVNETNATFAPTSGFYVNAEFETAGSFSGSAYAYNRFVVDAARFHSVASDLVLGLHLRTGVLDPLGRGAFREADDLVVHPRKRFFAGGPQSVRGFGQNLLGPRVLAVDADEECPDTPLEQCVTELNPPDFQERPVGGNALFESSLELRWRWSRNWETVGFVDVGQVSAALSDLDAPVASPGLGLRFFSPVGPLRVDVAYDPSESERLPVVAQLEGGREIQELETRVLFDPFTWDDPSTFREFLRRLKIHLSIGEAF